MTPSAAVTLTVNTDTPPPPPPDSNPPSGGGGGSSGGGGNSGGGGATPPPQEATALYSIPENGGQSWTTTKTSDPLKIGYARLEPIAGSMPPSGVAIFGFRTGGVLVTEAGVPASSKILSGRIYVDVDGPTNT